MILLRRRTIDAHGCQGPLDDATRLVEAMRTGAVAAGATVRAELVEAFLPHGSTCVLILAESHYVVSTWPEHAHVTLDVAVCDRTLCVDTLVEPVLAMIQPVRREIQAFESTPQAGAT